MTRAGKSPEPGVGATRGRHLSTSVPSEKVGANVPTKEPAGEHWNSLNKKKESATVGRHRRRSVLKKTPGGLSSRADGLTLLLSRSLRKVKHTAEATTCCCEIKGSALLLQEEHLLRKEGRLRDPGEDIGIQRSLPIDSADK